YKNGALLKELGQAAPAGGAAGSLH
ncbi:MAG: hypothetical protein JWP63_5981, partial [Candidatus Solibacter sp.]|nr:hypothetical protein [Candidatus Solibacter sp.]